METHNNLEELSKLEIFLDKSTWFLATALLLLILFSNITLNSGETQTESELLNSDNFEIEEVLEDSSPNTESE